MKNVILVLTLTILVEQRTALEKFQPSKLDKNRQRILEFLIKKIIQDRKHEPRLVVPDNALSSSDNEYTRKQRDLSSQDSKENSDAIKNESRIKVYLIKVKNNHDAFAGNRMKKILRNLDYYNELSYSKMLLRSTYPPKRINKYVFSDEVDPNKHKKRTTLAEGENQDYIEHKETHSNDLDYIVESSSLSNNQMDFNEFPVQQTAILEAIDDAVPTIAGFVKYPESEAQGVNFEDLKDFVRMHEKNFKEGGNNIIDTEKRDETESDLEKSAKSHKLDIKNEDQLKQFLKNSESDTEIEFVNENQLNKPKEGKEESSDFDFEMQTEHVDWSKNSKKKHKNKVSTKFKIDSREHENIKFDSREREPQDISAGLKNSENLRHEIESNKQKTKLNDTKNNNKDPEVTNFVKETTTDGIRQTAMIFEEDEKDLSSNTKSEEIRLQNLLSENKNNNVSLPGHSEKFKAQDNDNSILLSSFLRSNPNAAFEEDSHGLSFKEDPNQDYFNDYP